MFMGGVMKEKENIVDRLMLLSKKDQLDVVSRSMNVSLDTDNYGQIIIYTNMMYANNGLDVIEFK